MGCLPSKEHGVMTQFELSDWESPFVSSQVYRSRSATGGVKLQPFCAEYVSTSSNKSTYKAVHTSETFVFFALWEPVNGSQAAAFCKEHCYSLFSEYIQQPNITVEDCMYNTFAKLDKKFLTSQCKDQVKASVGAQGLMCYISLLSRRCWVAKLGGIDCVMAKAYGSGEHATIRAMMLSQDLDRAADVSAEVTVRANGSSYRDEHCMPDQDAGSWQSNRCGCASSIGVRSAAITPAIGLGYAKVKKLADVYQRSASSKALSATQFSNVNSIPEVIEYDIGRNDQHLVLATEGLMQQLSPMDIALLCHHFSLEKTRALRDKFLTPPLQLSNGTSGCGRISEDIQPADESDGPIPDSRDFNLASMLVRCARQRKGSSSKSGDDITALVLCLDWPKSLSSACISVGTYNDYQCVQHKLYRWQLLKLYSQYLAAKRRNTQQKWWTLVSGMAKQHKLSSFLQNFATSRSHKAKLLRLPLAPANKPIRKMKCESKIPTPHMIDKTKDVY